MMRRNFRTLGTDSEEFQHFVGRKPTKQEMNEWARLMQNGIHAQLDWDAIGEDAAQHFLT